MIRQRDARSERETEAVQSELAKASGLEGQARRSDVEDFSTWNLALATAENAERLSRGEVDPATKRRTTATLVRIRQGFDEAKQNAEAAKRDRALIDALARVRDARGTYSIRSSPRRTTARRFSPTAWTAIV